MIDERDSDDLATTSRPLGPLPLVLTVYFFADAIAASIVHANAGNGISRMFVACVFASQAMLITLWLGLGNTALVLRVLVALAWCGWAVQLFIDQQQWNREAIASGALLLLAGAAPYGFLKVLGFRLVRRDYRINVSLNRDGPAESTRAPRARVQFSIVQIFGWMLLVGIMATLVRLAGIDPTVLAIQFAVMGSIATGLGLAALWAVLGGKRVGARIFAPFGVVVLITIVLAAVAGAGAGEVVVYLFVTLMFTTSFVLGVMCAFRAAGYRISRQARMTARSGGDMSVGDRTGASSPWDAELQDH